MAKKKIAARKARSERETILSKIAPSEHIDIMSFDSEEWKLLVEGPEGEHWKKARGMVQALVKGRDRNDPLRTTAFQDKSPEDARNMFMNLVTDEEMKPIEEKFFNKFGDFTPVNYDRWASKVHSLWKTTTWNPDFPTLFKVTKEVIQEIREAYHNETGNYYISPLKIEEGYEKLPKGKNSGWPYFTSKWNDNENMVSYYKERADMLMNGINTLGNMPHMLFKRVQANGLENDPKMRPVECPPKHEAIAAKCFTDVFVNIFKTMKPYYGFNGGENVHQILGSFMKKEYLVEGDFSSFDQNCQEIMGVVFTVLMNLVDQKYIPYLRILLKYYQNSRLITPEGIITGKNGKINGLNSGEGWTSIIGTIANSIAVKYTMSRMDIRDYERLSFGDDIALATNTEFDTKRFENHMSELGMECNQFKQNCSSGKDAYFSFLGYYHFRKSWNLGCKGKFPIMRLASGLVFKERFEDLGGTPVTAEEMIENKSENIRLLGYAMKLNVCREHEDFDALVAMFVRNEPSGMPVDKILSVKSYAQALTCHRTSKSTSIENSAVINTLMILQNIHPGYLSASPDAMEETISNGSVDSIVKPELTQTVPIKKKQSPQGPHCSLKNVQPRKKKEAVFHGPHCSIENRNLQKKKTPTQVPLGPCCSITQKPKEQFSKRIRKDVRPSLLNGLENYILLGEIIRNNEVVAIITKDLGYDGWNSESGEKELIEEMDKFIASIKRN
jgi:hypothetical protein